MPRRKRTVPHRYLFALPIPYLDKNGRRLEVSQTEKWTRLALKKLDECLGGATPVPAPGTFRIGRKVWFEAGQTLVMSTCETRNQYLKQERRLKAFAERMAKALDQEAVYGLACPTDSFLIVFET